MKQGRKATAILPGRNVGMHADLGGAVGSSDYVVLNGRVIKNNQF
jgi:hypothetical protein